jgi:SAM-dependent methyltransferase
MQKNCDACNGVKHKKYEVPFKAITSTGKVWRQRQPLSVCMDCRYISGICDESWRADMEELYADYGTHPLGEARTEGGMVLRGDSVDGNLVKRVDCVYDFCSEYVQKNDLAMLDFGCGIGTTLEYFSRKLEPNKIKLDGFDIGSRVDNNHHQILKIKHVENFYSDFESITGKYDLITLVHVLEHVPNPLEVLLFLANKLNPDGTLFIAVPDAMQNPFQLMIADHFSHFSKSSLGAIVRNAGFNFIKVDNGFVRKELFLIAKLAPGTEAKKLVPEAGLELEMVLESEAENFIELNLEWLKKLIDQTNDLHVQHKVIGVFDTSIGAGWLYENCPNVFSFFVDEDTRWSGKLFYDKPIYTPRNVPAKSIVIIAQPFLVAKKIKQRLDSLYPSTKYVLPSR